MAISYFGLVHQGKAGFQDIERTVLSLVNLSLYLVPAFAVALGYSAVAGERERGSLEVLLAQPVTRADVLVGKYVGLSAVLATATLAGFGLPGLLAGAIVGFERFGSYVHFLITVVVMGVTFFINTGYV